MTDDTPTDATNSDDGANAHPESSKASGKDHGLSDFVAAALEASPGLPTARASISPYAFCLGVLAVIVLSRLASYLTPFQLYFSFQSFLFSTNDRLKWVALGVKLAIPALVGFGLYYVPCYGRFLAGGKDPTSPVVNYLANQADLSARCSAFFAALLMAWPFVVYWDLMVPPNVVNYKIPFLFIYFLYFISYTYFASFGVLVAKWFTGETLTAFQKLEIKQTASLIEGIRTSTMGVVTSALATYLSTTLAGAA